MADQLSHDLASLRIDRERPPGRGNLKIFVWVGVVFLLVVAGRFIVWPRLAGAMFKTEVKTTEIATVSPAQGSIDLTSTGYVTPQIISQVAAKVGGRVAKVLVKQGDVVQAGQVLLELDPVDHDAAIASAKARVAAAQATAQTARAQAAEADNQARLARDMFAKGVGAKQGSIDADARLRSLKAQVAAADAQARAAQAEVDALQVDLANYTVRAPIAGTVTTKPPEIGEIVGPAFGGMASQLGGIELADFSTLAVETDVPEGRLHLVALDRPCEIVLDAFPEKRYRGRVTSIVPKINRAKATVTVKVKFVDDATGVLPEMSARVSFLQQELDAAKMKEPPKTIVPGSAVAERGGGKVVFVIEDGAVRMVPIQLGAPFGDGFELTSKQPAAGTKVVADPPADLKDGQQIKEQGG